MRIALSFSVVLYALLIPYLEVNASHVFNPNWPPHARFHEVWQLYSNCMIGLLALWFIWAKAEVKMAGLLGMMVWVGILLAYITSPLYGGSIHSENLNATLLGLAPAGWVALIGLSISIAPLLKG